MAREREREGGGEGVGQEREKNNPSSKPLDKHSTSSKPLDKHSTPIDRHNKQEVMTEVSIRKVYRSRMDSLDRVSVC